MTIFSGVVAILSPSLVSRLPTYASDKTKGPLALGTVLERLQIECGVSCSRTAENVCMVQGEWDAIRKAYSFLDHHNALNSLCKPKGEDSNPSPDPPPPSTSQAKPTKRARRDKSPEAPVATSTPLSALSFSPSLKHRLASNSLLLRDSTNSPIAGARVVGSGSILDDIRHIIRPEASTAMAAAATTNTTNTTTARSIGGIEEVAEGSRYNNKTGTISSSSPTRATVAPTQGKSGAMKRKQGMPRKQLHNIGTPTVTPCPTHSDDEDMLDLKARGGGGGGAAGAGAMSQHAQDLPAFANGDSSIQIVAAWGNFKEDAIIGEGQMEPKQEPMSSGEEEAPVTPPTRFVYYQEDKSLGMRAHAPGTGVYTVQSDGQGGTVILPTVTEPVYVLNVTPDLTPNDENLTHFTTNEALCHSSSEKEDVKFKPATGKNLTARKSTSNRLAARKSTSQRTLLLLSKKISPQGGQKPVSCAKKGGKLSPQRRRGIIQGDSPIKGEFTCSYCQKVFNTKEAIHVHEEVYHTGRYKSLPSSSKSPLFECTQCGKSYMSKHALEEHLYTHVGMRPFACPYCAASFNHRKSLRRHVQLHNNVKRFDCPQCSKTFVRKDALESHLRIHKTEEDASSNDVN